MCAAMAHPPRECCLGTPGIDPQHPLPSSVQDGIVFYTERLSRDAQFGSSITRFLGRAAAYYDSYGCAKYQPGSTDYEVIAGAICWCLVEIAEVTQEMPEQLRSRLRMITGKDAWLMNRTGLSDFMTKLISRGFSRLLKIYGPNLFSHWEYKPMVHDINLTTFKEAQDRANFMILPSVVS